MYCRKTLAILAVGAQTVVTSGCGVIGPSCLERQQRGSVTSVTGSVDALQVVEQRGALRSTRFAERRRDQLGRSGFLGRAATRSLRNCCRLRRVHTTRAGCAERRHYRPLPDHFAVRWNPGTGCPRVRASWHMPCHVRGHRLPLIDRHRSRQRCTSGFSQYKLHVVGDAARQVSYSISITYFFGPDC